MSKPTFRAWATATAAAVQKGQDPLQEALKFASDRKVSLSSEQIVRLRQIVNADILPLLNRHRVQTGPKREMTDDPDGVSASKRQKMDDDDDNEEDVADSLGTLQLDDLPDEIIDVIAVQLGNVFDMGSLRATSTRFIPVVGYRRNKLREVLRRPFSGEAFVDYSNQDNIARLLKQTRSPVGPRGNLIWVLQWVSPIVNNPFFSPKTQYEPITIYSLHDYIAAVVHRHFKATNPDYWNVMLPFMSIPPMCRAAQIGTGLTAFQLLKGYHMMSTFDNKEVQLEKLPLHPFLSILNATSTWTSRGITQEARTILDKCTRLGSLYMIFYELTMEFGRSSAISDPTVNILPYQTYVSAIGDTSKIGTQIHSRIFSWAQRAVASVAPDFTTRDTNDEFLKIKDRIAFNDEELQYLVYAISKLKQDILDDIDKMADQMFTWSSHCAAQTQEQVDRCDSDSVIVSILAWDTDQTGTESYDKALLLAARAYIICTGTHINFDTPTTALEEMLKKLKDQAEELVDIESWDGYIDDAGDQEAQRREFEQNDRYMSGSTVLKFLAALNE